MYTHSIYLNKFQEITDAALLGRITYWSFDSQEKADMTPLIRRLHTQAEHGQSSNIISMSSQHPLSHATSRALLF